MVKIILSKNGDKRIRYGHPWVFKSDIEEIGGSFEPGDIVDVYGTKNSFLGRGYINPKSQITIRMLTSGHEEINRDFFYKRIRQSWEYRKKIADINCCRVVFAESDFLPALIVDKFSDYLVVQTLALGIDRYKPQIVDILVDIFKPLGIYERNDAPVRDLEGLDQKKGFLKGEFCTKVEITENGIKFIVDMENGQKTGYFLDQRENRAAMKPYVKNARVLDCFCHTGSFALHAAYYGAANVIGIDVSEQALECAVQNARINNLDPVCRFEAANTFDKLRELCDAHEKFDVVILDPPAFTKNRSGIQGAVRGYKEINLRAMKIINSGGILVSCSCSHHISPDMFMAIINDAGVDSKRKVRVVELRTQAKDHPILLASKETQYLKCAILQII